MLDQGRTYPADANNLTGPDDFFLWDESAVDDRGFRPIDWPPGELWAAPLRIITTPLCPCATDGSANPIDDVPIERRKPSASAGSVARAWRQVSVACALSTKT